MQSKPFENDISNKKTENELSYFISTSENLDQLEVSYSYQVAHGFDSYE